MPTPIEWNPALQLGIPSLDQQHREMVTVLNQLATYTAPDTPDDPNDAAVPHLLEQLYHHARHHFHYEEELMATIDFHGLHAHHHEHGMLLAELKTFIGQINQGQAMLDSRALNALKDWLMLHIIGSDRNFAVVYLRRTAAAITDIPAHERAGE